ncbi:unnamed protein product [Trichobilharzia regenti]|nr:unnamed protein product [Trichobilharzia regenti]
MKDRGSVSGRHTAKSRLVYLSVAEINSLCGCNAIEFPYLNESLPFCLELSSFVKEGNCEINPSISQNSIIYNSIRNQSLLNNITSSSSTKDKNIDGISKLHLNPECLSELEAVKNRVLCKSEVTKHYQFSWLSTRAGRKVASRPDLAGYRLAKQKLEIPGGEKEAQEFLSKSNVLERNLLAIMLIRPNFNVHRVDEKEVLSLTSLLSQSGGLLSIWIGLNMMSVIEVVELIIHLFRKCRQFSKTKRLRQSQRRQIMCDTTPTQQTNTHSELEVVEVEDKRCPEVNKTEYNGKENRIINNGPTYICPRRRSPSVSDQTLSTNLLKYSP